MEKEQLFQKRMTELSKNAYYRDILTFSDFLDLNEQNILSSLSLKEYGVRVETFGGYESAERQMAAFIPDALSFCLEDVEASYPITCIRIAPSALKFAEKLSHRDYLGAILNLGIERSKIGDLLVTEKEAFLFCQQSLVEFITTELCRVKHTSVVLSEILDPAELPKPAKVPVSGTVTSIRLDSMIALAFSTSRSSMVSYIESGKVFVNGKCIVSNGYVLKENDIISVRGKGKFQYGKATGMTKKNKHQVTVYLYQ